MIKLVRTALRFIGKAVTAVVGPCTWENAKTWIKLVLLVLIIRWICIEPYKIPSNSMRPTLHGDPRFLRGDRVLVNKFAYGPRLPFTNTRLFRLGEPKRWDIVVFRALHEDVPRGLFGVKRPLIKRVVGLPGERVHIADGKVYINGEPLRLPEGMPDVRYTVTPEPPEESIQWIEATQPPGTRDVAIAALRAQYREARPFQFGILLDDLHSVVPEDCCFVLGDNSGQSVDGRYFGWVPNRHILGRAFCICWPLAHFRDLTGFTESPSVLAFLYGLLTFAVLYAITRTFLFRSCKIKDEHAAPLSRGDHVFVNCLAFGLRVPFSTCRITRGRLPIRGETALYRAPDTSEQAGRLLLGRVAGLPGEPLAQGRDSTSVRATSAFCANGLDDVEPARVPPDHFFIMAEGPGETADSRTFGPVAYERLIGSVPYVWWPVCRARRLGV